MSKLPDGKIARFVLEEKGTKVRVDMEDLVLCKHCERYETTYCPFVLHECFRPDDDFFCAFGNIPLKSKSVKV